ncbi:hypothetical protein [Streptomyces sp. CBMA152]|uniref:hypothetical protein n=1 Tax=Streptomyces sp. CBMA152 TaxID=1896312 RepID=UPI001660DBE1|nr:hypothetical protein [Streptomyces sp. CBMA152]MBD0743619.1 hypothetical protein [Streptomyces sp. CBMA152]
MNTTTAALEARVTVPTIRTWCRIGAVAAIKQAGRWVIDTASLRARIAIGHRRSRMSDQPTYRVQESQVTRYGNEYTVYRITRTDGTPAGFGPGQDSRIWSAEFSTRNRAEFYAEFYERTPEGYRLEYYRPPARSIGVDPEWQVKGGLTGDPRDINAKLPADWTSEGTKWAEGTTLVDALVSWVERHTAGAAQRIQEQAEKDAIEAAEEAVREARREQLAEAQRQKGALATPRQVDYIVQLLAVRERTGEGGGFFIGPKDRAGIELLSKAEASSYSTSLKGDY